MALVLNGTAGTITGLSEDGLPDTVFNNFRRDISVLAFQMAQNSNQVAFNLPNAFVDQFEDTSGIASHSSTGRSSSGEYVGSMWTEIGAFTSDSNTKLLIHSDTTDGSQTFTDSSGNNTFGITNATHKTTQAKIGSSSIYFASDSISIGDSTDCNWGRFSNNWTVEMWVYPTASSNTLITVGSYNSNTVAAMGIDSSSKVYIRTDSGGNWSWDNSITTTMATAISLNTWTHIAWSNNGGTLKGFINGEEDVSASHSKTNSYTNPFFLGSYFNNPSWFAGYMDEIRISDTARYTSDFVPNDSGGKNASGTMTSATQTAGSTVENMSVVVMYEDAYGTTTLNTDLIVKVSADGGSNYTTVTLENTTALSSSIKVAKCSLVSVTSGTAPKYQISFANQSQGSKEVRVHGVSLLY